MFFFFFSSRRRHTRYWRDWSSDVCSSDLNASLPWRYLRSSCGEPETGCSRGPRLERRSLASRKARLPLFLTVAIFPTSSVLIASCQPSKGSSPDGCIVDRGGDRKKPEVTLESSMGLPSRSPSETDASSKSVRQAKTNKER